MRGGRLVAKTTMIFILSVGLVVVLFPTVYLSEEQAARRALEDRNEFMTQEMADLLSALIDYGTVNAIYDVLKNRYKGGRHFIVYIKVIRDDYRFMLSTDPADREWGLASDPRDIALVNDLLKGGGSTNSAEVKYHGERVHDVGVRVSASYGDYVLKVGYYLPMRFTPYVGLIGVGVAMIALALFYLLIRRIIRPIQRLTADAGRIAGGDTNRVAAGTERGDEIGELARALNDMVAELNRRQAQLAESERLAVVGRGTWRIAHNIGNLLNPLDAYLDVLRQRIVAAGGMDAEARAALARIDEHLDSVRRDIQRMRRAVPDRPRLEPYSIPALLDASLERILRPADVAVERLYADDLPAVEVDPEQMADVFSNLILNAYQAMEAQGGHLTIRVERVGGAQIAVTFADTGPGIPEAEQGTLFTFFHTYKSGGMGIGLASAAEVVKLHGGHIDVRSTPGEGATFVVTIPRRPQGSVKPLQT